MVTPDLLGLPQELRDNVLRQVICPLFAVPPRRVLELFFICKQLHQDF